MTVPAKPTKKTLSTPTVPAAPKSKPVMSDKLKAFMEKRGLSTAADADINDAVVSTGLLSVDKALGGGWAKGRINELTGESGVGKTTMAMVNVAARQKAGDICGWVDVEQSFNRELAAACGIDLESLIFANPFYAEDATELVLGLVDAGVQFIVIDSIGAYNPKKKQEAEVGHVGQPAQRARAVGELAERLIAPLAQTGATVLAINHLTGLLQTDYYGNQKTTAKGGKTWNYLKSTSLDLKAKKTEETKDGSFVAEVTATVKKSRRSAREGAADLLNIMGHGFSVEHDLIEMGLEYGVIEKAGNWLRFADLNENGRAKFLEALVSQPEVAQTLRDTVESLL